MCCAIALAGFRVGALIRTRLTDKLFRMAILWGILLLGIRLVVTNAV